MPYTIIGAAVILIIIAAGIIFTRKRNNEINRSGIETDAVVTRVKESTQTDADGSITGVSYTYYVTYRTMEGETVEAKLGSGKSFDVRITSKTWDSDLHEGSNVRIKYLPEKPKYAIRIQ